jgi:hypothetical protein
LQLQVKALLLHSQTTQGRLAVHSVEQGLKSDSKIKFENDFESKNFFLPLHPASKGGGQTQK